MQTLHKMFEAQRIHQTGERGSEFLPKDEQMRYIREMCLALNVEVAEMLQELPWKPWKPVTDQKIDMVKAEEEWADCFIFLMNIWLAMHPASSVASTVASLVYKIRQKQIINNERQLKRDMKS